MVSLIILGWKAQLAKAMDAETFERQSLYDIDKECTIAVLLDTLYQLRERYGNAVPDHLANVIQVAELVYDNF